MIIGITGMQKKKNQKENSPGKFFRQPPGILEIPHSQVPQDMPEAQGYYFALPADGGKQIQKQKNLKNLPDGYYEQLTAGKQLDWIKCYAQADYTFVKEGKSVWHEFEPQSMIAELEPDPKYPVQVGLDFGLTPAAVFCQKVKDGRWHILHELVTFDIGLNRFVSMLKSEMEMYFPGYKFNVWEIRPVTKEIRSTKQLPSNI